MGQRLVITVKRGERPIASVYFHWSAYSTSALYELSNLKEMLEGQDIGSMTDEQIQLILIHGIERNVDPIYRALDNDIVTGGIDGGSDSREWEYITSRFPNEVFKGEKISRNMGLIAISPEGMARQQWMSEGDMTLDLDTMAVVNDVMFSYDSIEDVNEGLGEDGLVTEESVYKGFSVDPSRFSLSDLPTVISEVSKAEDEGFFLAEYDDVLFEFVM